MANAQITRLKENNITWNWDWLWFGWQAATKSTVLGSKCVFNLPKIRNLASETCLAFI